MPESPDSLGREAAAWAMRHHCGESRYVPGECCENAAIDAYLATADLIPRSQVGGLNLRIMDLEDGIEQAQWTIEFLHSCLTNPHYHYGYPDQTLKELERLHDLYPPSPGCAHAAHTKRNTECPAHLTDVERRRLRATYQDWEARE